MNRNHVKRSKERCLEEAFHLLKQIPEAALRGLEERQLLLLVRLLLSLQLQAVSISTACRKVDQVKTWITFPLDKSEDKSGISLQLIVFDRWCSICQSWTTSWF